MTIRFLLLFEKAFIAQVFRNPDSRLKIFFEILFDRGKYLIGFVGLWELFVDFIGINFIKNGLSQRFVWHFGPIIIQWAFHNRLDNLRSKDGFMFLSDLACREEELRLRGDFRASKGVSEKGDHGYNYGV